MSTRVFITGGASGLGRALAERYAKAGARVAIADVNDARGTEALAALRGVATDADYIHCDVTREEDLVAARERLVERWGGVDVVVNNAGVAMAGGIEDVSVDDWRWIIDINLLGVVRGCHVFTPVFKRQKSGHFVNIASMAGLLDVPFMSGYNATKAAVVSLSETLQNELAGDGVGVSVVCPSFFQTNLAESLRAPDRGFHVVVGKLLARGSITAADVAEDIFTAVAEKRFYVLPHSSGRTAWLMKRFLPRRLYRAISEKQMQSISRARDKANAGTR
ncbi:Oxidoreductase, short chain dehydrogenase/reductase family protein [Minicystis rosea]|nr:Oxidoreductase, short chain dehydrogenase/reductase family protein [Minicystis rosea]